MREATRGCVEHVEYVLRLGDSALVLGQRLSEWCGHGPVLEEDIALTNIALDLIGQARLLLAHAGALEGRGRDEDAIAMRRDAGEFRNFTMLELPNGDYAFTVVRNLLYGAFACEQWPALRGSADPELAAIAARSLKEARYHLEHASDWVVRLGDGTEESTARVRRALDELWPYANEFFTTDAVERAVAEGGIGIEAGALRPAWLARVQAVLSEAKLDAPVQTRFASTGKLGVHSEYLGHLLAEMQFLQRAYPGAHW